MGKSRIDEQPGTEFVPGGFGRHLGEVVSGQLGTAVGLDCFFHFESLARK